MKTVQGLEVDLRPLITAKRGEGGVLPGGRSFSFGLCGAKSFPRPAVHILPPPRNLVIVNRGHGIEMAKTDSYCAFDESWEPAGEKYQRRSFSSWSDVSKWLNKLLDPPAAPSEPLVAKAKDLLSNNHKEFDRIAAIGRYVQGLSNVNTGGAHRPHSASQVFANGYGDCKDKANLLRTMLSSVGVEAWLAAINTGELGYVLAERPSLGQFDHVIVAIRVSDQVQAESVAKYRTFGRLLFFDPTDKHIPFGLLPARDFGIQALIVAGENGKLVRMPSPQVAHPADRRRDLTSSADGDTTAHGGECNGVADVLANRSFRNSGSLPKNVPNLPKKKPFLARKVPVR